jgi:hypothetical protein
VILHTKYTKRRLNDFNIYAQVWMNLGLALRAQGRLGEAVDSLQRAAVLSEGTGTAAAAAAVRLALDVNESYRHAYKIS